MKFGIISLPLLLAFTLHAGQTRQFVLDTPRTLVGSTSRGVAVFPDGSLRPISPLTQVATFEEPLGLALALAPDGSAIVGTGHPARIWRVMDGKKELLAEPKADQITAVLVDPQGEIYVSTAIPALLIKLAKGKGAMIEVARLKEGNLWDLAWFADGLYAAAGNPGRLMRLVGQELQEVAKVPDRHARCLLAYGDNLLIGTSGKGFVLRYSPQKGLGVVYDSPFTEIVALASTPDGLLFAAGLTGDPNLGKVIKDEGEGIVSVSESTTSTPATDKGPSTSEIIRILPTGASVVAHRFTKPIASAIAWGGNGLVIGTGIDGELWQLVEGTAVMLDTVDAAQVMRVVAGGDWLLTQGPVKLFHRSGSPAGTFTSPALDAGQPAVFGEASLEGVIPAPTSCSLRFRSGATTPPDETWSEWSKPSPCPGGQTQTPQARYFQWQATLADKADKSTRIGRVVVSYRQLNVPPEIKELIVYPPGEVYLKTPPPSDKVIEVQHPDLSGIFTTLDDDGEKQSSLGKKYYRVGYQTVSWKTEDPNNDPLRFTVEIQRNGSESWWKIREELDSIVLSLDTQALVDGLYRFRLTTSDAVANPARPAITQSLSSWFVVDNTAPVMTIKRDGANWIVSVSDALSPLLRVEFNRDADTWHNLEPNDGVLDGRQESFRIPAAKDAHLLSVRAVDDHHNRVIIALEEKP